MYALNVHVLQHVAFEGLGSIQEWLDTLGAQTSYTRFFENDRLPAWDKVDLLIAMGGPMSVGTPHASGRLTAPVTRLTWLSRLSAPAAVPCRPSFSATPCGTRCARELCTARGAPGR